MLWFYLVGQHLLLYPGLLLGLLQSQAQLLFGLGLPAQSSLLSLTDSAGVHLMKLRQLPDNR